MNRLVERFFKCKLVSRSSYCINTMHYSKDGRSIKEAKSVVTPYVNLNSLFQKKNQLENSLIKRGCKESLSELEALWSNYISLLEERKTLEQKREANSILIREKPDKETLDKLKNDGKILRESYKETSSRVTHLENTLIPRALSLPNLINRSVSDDEVVLKHHLETFHSKSDHLNTGRELDILEVFTPYLYYLKGIGTEYELAVSKAVVRLFKELDFIRLSNPDFSRLPIVEGCQGENSKSTVITLDDSSKVDSSPLCLNGGAHFFMFCALHTNTVAEFSKLPLKYVTHGRCYSPVESETFRGLYGVVQKPSVSFFVGSDEESCSTEFDKLIELLWSFYKSLNFPVQMVQSPISELGVAQSLKISFRLWSSSYDKFVEVGNISRTDDYVSRRLRMYYKDGDSLKFLHVIHGNAVQVPALLGCLLDNQPDEALSLLKQHLNLFKKMKYI